ncbi:MAG: hypothetical protein Q9218_007414, partial [Villophora microphyllina]
MAVVPELPMIPKTGVPLRWLETDLPRDGSIYRLTQPRGMDPNRIILPRQQQPKADFDLIRTWLGHCRGSHKFCKPRKPRGASLKNFRVIDCTTPTPQVTVQSWSERYVALSYVWGNCKEKLPKTIIDAVEVTRELGEQYLWVDRLCIDQGNEEEKLYFFPKMDMIYAGAEFTIVGAAGDARTGLPGVTTKQRKPQIQVELSQRSGSQNIVNASTSIQKEPDIGLELVGVPLEEYELEREDEDGWLDDYRHGLTGSIKIDIGKVLEDQDVMERYEISREHLEVFQELSHDFAHSDSLTEFLEKTKELARRIGIPLKELIPHLQGQANRNPTQGNEPEPSAINLSTLKRSIARPAKPFRPLPPSRIRGKTILVSLMQEPRMTIRNSRWATRGWTYQESVLSHRRLVFTEEQAYWECCGLALSETTDLHPHILQPKPGAPMPSYMLSGIFEDDMHSIPNLQYGFRSSSTIRLEVSQQVQQLASHIRTYTSRTLSNDSDSLNAFLGIAAYYSINKGISLLLGLPVWVGLFADGKFGLQHSLALALSVWKHTAQPVEPGAAMYIADCPRRAVLPSWTWAGWQGTATFSSEESADIGGADTVYSDYLLAWTSEDWVHSIDDLWSAEMILHDEGGTDSMTMVSDVPLPNTNDVSKKWLLTVRNPLVLKHMYLMRSRNEWEWRRLMDWLVEIHLSVPMTEQALTAGHKSGELATVLVFTGTVPFIWNDVARFLILRKTDDGKPSRWERIGILTLRKGDEMMCRHADYDTEKMIRDLPVRGFGEDMQLG